MGTWVRRVSLAGMLAVWGGAAFAAPAGPGAAAAHSAFALDLGAYADNVQQRIAGSTSGSTISGFFRLRPTWAMTSAFSFEPSLAFIVPWRNGADGFAKSLTALLGIDFGWSIASWLKLRVGSAVQSNMTWGRGTAVDLNNGTGTTTFYTPEGFTAGFIFLAEAGLEFRLASNVSLGAEVWISQLANPTNRRFMAAAYLGVYL